MSECIEYETRCSILIESYIANSIQEQIQDSSRYMYVFYYENGNRMTCNVFQRKEQILPCRRLLYMSGEWDSPLYLPMVRTVSREVNLTEDEIVACNSNFIVSKVKRLVLKKDDEFRICIEWRANQKGVTTTLTAEVEYTEEVRNNYTELVNKETQLVCTIKDELLKYTNNNTIRVNEILSIHKYCDKIDISTLCSVPCRVFNKLQNIKITNSNNVYYKYKYDGFKGKMVCYKENMCMYQDDAHVYLPRIYTGFLNSLPNLFIQVENMCNVVVKNKEVSNKCNLMNLESLIITDILGIKMGGFYYRPEPMNVLKFLQTYKAREVTFPMLEFGNKTIFVQSIITRKDELSNLNTTDEDEGNEDVMPIDGKILIYEDREYKYKIPTFDIKIKNNKGFVKTDSNVNIRNNSDNQINDQFFEQKNGIYEVSFKDRKISRLRNKLVVLRARTDRINPSTLQEVEDAEVEMDVLRKYSTVKSKLKKFN